MNAHMHFDDTKSEFYDGRVSSVSYMPAGIGTGVTPNNKDNLRKSEKDGTNKTIITVASNIPYCFNGMTSYTNDKIREIMADINGDWFPTELSASIARGDI